MPTFLQQPRQALKDFIAQYLPDNTEQLITPLALRTVLLALVESMWVKLTDLLAGPNLQPSLHKAVRWYSDQAARYDGDGPTLADLDPATMCLYTTISCDFGPTGQKAQYVLVPAEEGAAGAFEVYRDATFTGPRMWVTFALADSPAAAASGIPEFNPYGPGADGYAGPDENGHNGAQVTFASRLWQTKQPAKASDYDPPLIPTPGTPEGAAVWRELSPTPLTHLQNTDTGTTAPDFVIGLNSQTQGTAEYRLLKFLCDAQRPNVALGVRWQDNDTVELVQCRDYAPPAARPGNVWEPVGGGVRAAYIEDGDLIVDTAAGSVALQLPQYFVGRQGGQSFELRYQAADGQRREAYATLPAVVAAVAALPMGVPASIHVFPGRTALPSGLAGHWVQENISIAQRDVTLYLEPGAVLEMRSASLLNFAVYVNTWQQFSQAPARFTLAGPGLFIGFVQVLGNSGATQVRLNARMEGAFTTNYFGIPSGAAADEVVLGPACHLRRAQGAPIILSSGNGGYYGAPIALTLDRARLESGDNSPIMKEAAAAANYGGTVRVIDTVFSPELAELATLAYTYQAATPGGSGGGGGGPAPDLTNYYTKPEADARYLTSPGLRLVLPPGQVNGTCTISVDEAGTFTAYELAGGTTWQIAKNGGTYSGSLPLTLAAGDTCALTISGRTSGEGILKLKTVMALRYKTIRFLPVGRAILFNRTLAQCGTLALPGTATAVGDALTWEIGIRAKLTAQPVGGYLVHRGFYDEYAIVGGFDGTTKLYYWSNRDNATGALVYLEIGEWGLNTYHVATLKFSRASLSDTTGALELYYDGQIVSTTTIPVPLAGPDKFLSLARLAQGPEQGYYISSAVDWVYLKKDGDTVVRLDFDEESGSSPNTGSGGGAMYFTNGDTRELVTS